MTPSPSELLTAAADRIQDLAAPTTPGPWRAYYDTGLRSVDGPGGEAVCTDAENNVEWIAALSPAVAPALFGLLTTAAAHEGLCGPCGFCAAAHSLARLVCPELAREDT
jgi:hypothetical protein